ncbi:uncharacterized protein LOC105691173 [Athalia rosae]|uniref:uncharacterized protein LOC105691173 n=1 Tax=Athalia rosae TaxID=37344 RepID=UPI00203495A3|nr:uncharacterized protein LOC105691173 [Athalia rosae]
MGNHRVLLLFICFGVVLHYVDGFYHKQSHDDSSEEDEDVLTHKLHKQHGANKEWARETGYDDEDEKWTGRWMPSRSDDPTPPPKVLHKTGKFKDHNVPADPDHLIGMGVQSKQCDDGKTNLRVDWNWSPVNYTCYDEKIVPNYLTRPLIYCEHIPSSYVPVHKCMTEIIEYDDDIPIYGSHRPVWPVYGEYKFIPKQRWIHSLEHGAIVMLYHPCANPMEVKRLKKILSSCLRRHIITPYTSLNEDRPLALLSWGCRLTMSVVNPTLVKHFIKSRALRGPEPIAKHGAFSEFLKHVAKTITDEEDTTICPEM